MSQSPHKPASKNSLPSSSESRITPPPRSTRPITPIVPRNPNRLETPRLEKLIPGGWKKNGLRYSYGSYRIAATKDIATTSLEMDNSPQIIKKHYLEAKTQAEAYINILPEEHLRNTNR